MLRHTQEKTIISVTVVFPGSREPLNYNELLGVEGCVLHTQTLVLVPMHLEKLSQESQEKSKQTKKERALYKCPIKFIYIHH